MSALRVLASGPCATVQDLGRPGHAHLGVPPSGALDAPALRRANRRVGNPEGAAGIEVTFGGLRVVLEGGRWVAVSGAPAPLRSGGQPVPLERAFFLEAGAELALGWPPRGVRSYLAVAGGLTPPAELGSRSTDTLCGLGPPRLARGDVLPLGEPRAAAAADPDPPALLADLASRPLRIHPGPRADWFDERALHWLTSETYEVSAQSDRVGVRLCGRALARRRPEELPSEGLVTGALQVPTGGQPLIFLADHPTTGGYPVLAVLDPADLPRLAQARPGSALRFALA